MRFLVFATITVGISSRFSVRIPRANTNLTVSDTFVFLVQSELLKPFSLNGHEVYTTASIGIRLSMDGRENAENMLRDADTAMYRVKDKWKGTPRTLS